MAVGEGVPSPPTPPLPPKPKATTLTNRPSSTLPPSPYVNHPTDVEASPSQAVSSPRVKSSPSKSPPLLPPKPKTCRDDLHVPSLSPTPPPPRSFHTKLALPKPDDRWFEGDISPKSANSIHSSYDTVISDSGELTV